MKKIISLIILAFIITSTFGQNAKASINFNKNIEFLGYIIELVDPGENDINHPVRKIIHQFPEDLKQPTLNEILQIAGNIDYSTLIHLMYYLPQFPLAKDYTVSNNLAAHLNYTSKEDYIILNLLVQKTNAFYKVSNFKKVWKGLSNERKKVTQFIKNNKPSNELFHQMEIFYGKEFKEYNIIPSLTLWSAGFGVNDSKKNTANFILGPLKKNYDFNHKTDFLNLTIHEFGHSFVNSIVLENSTTIKKSEKLFTTIKESMKRQGYSNWSTCLIEHFVRAGEIIINEQLGNLDTSNNLLNTYSKERNFKYLPFIVNQLKEYRLKKGFNYKNSVKKTIEDLEYIN